MSILKEYEIKVLYLLASGVLSPEQLEALVTGGEFAGCEYTGCGYFLSIRHPGLPQGRIVCHEPTVAGSNGTVICGFVIFIETGELTIECYSLGDPCVPEGFRDSEVKITSP